MGSGKTSMGKLISEKLELDFFDIDKCIERELDLKSVIYLKIKEKNILEKLRRK